MNDKVVWLCTFIGDLVECLCIQSALRQGDVFVHPTMPKVSGASLGQEAELNGPRPGMSIFKGGSTYKRGNDDKG